MSRVFTDSTNNIAFTPGWSTLGAITASAWIKWGGGGGGTLPRILQRSNADTGWKLYLDNSSLLTFFQWNGAGGIWQCTSPSTGVWLHLAVTYVAGSTSNDAAIYFNGIAQTVTRNASTAGTDDAGTLYIGNRASLTRGFDGPIGEVGIWNRALSVEEIRASMVSPLRMPSGLVLYAPLHGVYSPEPDWVGGLLGTVTGTSLGAHAPVGVPLGSRRVRRLPSLTAATDNTFIPYAGMYPLARRR